MPDLATPAVKLREAFELGRKARALFIPISRCPTFKVKAWETEWYRGYWYEAEKLRQERADA